MKLIKLIIILIIVMILVTGCANERRLKSKAPVEDIEKVQETTVTEDKTPAKSNTPTETMVTETTNEIDLGVTNDELEDLENEFNNEFVEDIDILGFE